MNPPKLGECIECDLAFLFVGHESLCFVITHRRAEAAMDCVCVCGGSWDELWRAKRPMESYEKIGFSLSGKILGGMM